MQITGVVLLAAERSSYRACGCLRRTAAACLGCLYLTAVSDAQREQEHCKVALTVLLVSSRLRSQLDYRVQQTVNELQHGHDYE